MAYDPNTNYMVQFVGGPLNGKEWVCLPADRLVWNQNAPDGTLIKQYVYNIAIGADPNTGEVIKVVYNYQP